MSKIIQPRAEYAIKEIAESGLTELFLAFEKGFREYVGSKLGKEHAQQAPNFNRYKGDLERACHAAQSVGHDYGIGIGIARKGLWLSYIFHLHGLPTYDVLAIRIDHEKRFTHSLSSLYKNVVNNKKLVLFDNDLVTGRTIGEVAQRLMTASPQWIDLLLVYGHTQISYDYFNEIRQFQKSPKELGVTPDGMLVLDTMSEVPKAIRKGMTLETNFAAGRESLAELCKTLGVRL